MQRPELDPSERAELLAALDRLEERLEVAQPGLHALGDRADAQTLAASGLPAGPALLWARYDGIELVSGEAKVFALAELEAATAAAAEEGLLREGDRVIGERGRVVFVLPADPWAEGADVVSITEENERAPEATSVVHLVLGLLGEIAVLYDDHGEFHADLIDEWGELTGPAQRKLQRRRLDLDPYAPGPRLRLAQTLRAAGEFRAALKEVDKVLHYAPEYPAAHFERGHLSVTMERREQGRRAFAKAAEFAADDVSAALYEAWAALTAEDESVAARHAERVTAKRPEFAQHQLAGARAQLARDDAGAAARLVTLGLAVAPRNLELLELKRQLDGDSVAPEG